ncbi:MAG: adenylate/guanylate cyclase domain-containing protein, partial [Alphaproteobacteria bacterium]
RRLAVILMADMVDYSRLMENDLEGTIRLIRELRDRWLEPEIGQRGGEVLKRLGDGWIVAFSSVSDAVEAAQAAQVALAAHPQIKLRIALHLGEIVDDGTDLYGTGINIAARLQAEAPPGGVMVSEDVHRQFDSQRVEHFAEAGTFELKNIAQPVRAFQWRPAGIAPVRADEVPTIAVEQVVAAPDADDLRAAAADLREQLLHRLSCRTGIRVLSADAAGGQAPT